MKTIIWKSATIIWNFSEFSGIGLGRFAPFVFGKIIGSKGKRIT